MTLTTAIALRSITGVCLAGVYPPGMKLIATWFREGRGFALGVLIGALTLGKASPYLINAIGSKSWRFNVGIASMFAVLGAMLIVALRARRAVRAAESAVRHHAGDEGLPQPRRAARELRLLRTHVGAVRDVDVGAGDDPRQPRGERRLAVLAEARRSS